MISCSVNCPRGFYECHYTGTVIPVDMSKPCPDCGYKFKNINDYFEHDCTEVNAPWYCTKCKTMFHTRKDYKKHKCKKSEVYLTKCYCGFCGHRFISTKKRKNHERFCKGENAIPSDPLSFWLHWHQPLVIKDFSDLVIKMRKRQKEREMKVDSTLCDTWTCKDCGKEFANNNFKNAAILHEACLKCLRSCDVNPTHTVELTEEERSRLFNIIGASYTSNPFNPLSDTGKRWMAFHDTLIAKLRKPKKESVEFEINEWYGGIIKHGTVFIWAKTKEHESFGITYGRPDFEKLIVAYKARKVEVR